MVDVTEDFLIKARTYLGEEGKRVRNYFCCGLQDFSPEPNSYDVIWIQWVIGELSAALSTFHTLSTHLPLQRRVPPGALGATAPMLLAAGRTTGVSPVLPGLAFHALSVPVVTHLGAVFC